MEEAEGVVQQKSYSTRKRAIYHADAVMVQVKWETFRLELAR